MGRDELRGWGGGGMEDGFWGGEMGGSDMLGGRG